MTGGFLPPEPQLFDSDDILLGEAFGVGWVGAAVDDMLDETARPGVAIGAQTIHPVDGHRVNVNIATSFKGAAQLAGQLEALRLALPPEQHYAWGLQAARAQGFAAEALPITRERMAAHNRELPEGGQDV